MYKIVITAGGTSEKIDNVRKITNSSSGKLGSVIATKLLELQDDKIEKIPLEEYIVGVLAGEMPINFELEALKAQAVGQCL